MNYLNWLELGFLGYFSGINVLYSFFLILSAYKVISRFKEARIEDPTPILSSDSLPSILFVIPMYNESEHVISNIRTIKNLSYRYKRVVAVNDGSTDDTLQLLKTHFDLVEIPKYYTDAISTKRIRAIYQSKTDPEVMVIDKERGFKFDAINAAVNAIQAPFFVVLDADTFIDSKGFEALIRPILTSSETIAVGATVRIFNGCSIQYNQIVSAGFPTEALPALQAVEYLRAFLLREGFDAINGNFIVAGAFSIFPRELIVQVGGFAPSAGEDVEIIVRLHRIMREKKIRYHIRYLPDPVAWTVVPNRLGKLGKQRSKWHLGLLESIWFHKSVCFNPRYRGFGLFGFPFWFLGEAMEPIVETAAWIYVVVMWSLGLLNTSFFLLFLLVSYGFISLYTIFCLVIEEFSFRKYPSIKNLTVLFICNILENIGYHQCTVYWRLRSFFWFFSGFKEIRKSSALIQRLVKEARVKVSD